MERTLILMMSALQLIMPRKGWRWLLALSSLPSLLLLIFYRVTPESPRYLCLKGRTAEAHHILEKIAIFNGTPLPSGDLVSDQERELETLSLITRSLDEDNETPEGTEEEEDSTSKALETENEHSTPEWKDSNIAGISALLMLLSPELIRSTLLLWVVFFGNAFLYYGLVLLTTELNKGHNNCAEKLQSEKSQDIDYKDVFITSFAGLVFLICSINLFFTFMKL